MLASPALAASKDATERAAKTACAAGDYAKGVALLAELYVATDKIIYIYNQGRCYQQNGKYEEAILRFREFQRKNLDTGNKIDSKAEENIAECKALLRDQSPQPPPAAAAQVARHIEPPAQPATPPTQVEPQPVVQQEGPTPPSSSEGSPGSSLRGWGIGLAAAGAAGLATGLGLNLKANSLASELQKSTRSYSRDKESTRSTYQTWGWVAYGAGAGLLTAGAVMYFVGYQRGHESQVAFLPWAGQGEMGAVLKGAF